MANSIKLVMTFECEDGNEHNFSWTNAQAEPRTADVRTLASTMINNGSIFTYVPTAIISAKTVVTTENGIDVTD